MSEEVVWNVYGTYNLCGQTIMNVFIDSYALYKLKIKMNNENAPIFIEKYNVIGWEQNKDYFTLYETPSLNKIIRLIKINDIQEIKIVK